jgi:hypothetical protein
MGFSSSPRTARVKPSAAVPAPIACKKERRVVEWDIVGFPFVDEASLSHFRQAARGKQYG